MKSFVIFLREVNGVYYFAKKKKISSGTVRLGDKTYIIDLSKNLYIRKSKNYYFMDIDKNLQLIFSEVEGVINPEDLDILISRKIVSQLSYGLRENTLGLQATSLVIGGILGAAIAAIVFMVLIMNGVI